MKNTPQTTHLLSSWICLSGVKGSAAQLNWACLRFVPKRVRFLGGGKGGGDSLSWGWTPLEARRIVWVSRCLRASQGDGEAFKRGNRRSKILWWGLFDSLLSTPSCTLCNKNTNRMSSESCSVYWASALSPAGNTLFFERRNWSSESFSIMLGFEPRHSDSRAQRILILRFLLLGPENWFCSMDCSSIAIFSIYLFSH